LNAFVAANMGQLNALVKQHVPNSLGNCNDHNPPQPCQCFNGCNNLYFVHKKWQYKAYARWISGLQTGHFTNITFSAVPGTISIRVTGLFDALPLSLWIGECLTFDQCVKIWDNTEGCCGTNKHFAMDIDLTCSNSTPHLTAARIRDLQLDPFVITEKIVGVKVDLQDITNTIEGVVTSLITDYLTTKKFIPYNGTQVTLLQFVNANIPPTFTCPNSDTMLRRPVRHH